MSSDAIRFKKVIEYENAGKRYRKVTGAEAKTYEFAVRDTYETAAGPTFGFFVPVEAKPKPEPAAT